MGLHGISCLRFEKLKAKNVEKIGKKGIDIFGKAVIIPLVPAGVAHPVERHLAKVEVASSSLVTRSRK